MTVNARSHPVDRCLYDADGRIVGWFDDVVLIGSVRGFDVMDEGAAAAVILPGTDVPKHRDWCESCRRNPCWRYAKEHESGRNWCPNYEYANRETGEEVGE